MKTTMYWVNTKYACGGVTVDENGKIDFKYKYHVALENRLYEKELYIPYLEGFIDV